MSKAYPLTIGEIECAVLHEGSSIATSESLANRYPGRSPQEIEAALGASESEGSLNLLYVKSGDVQILADVGFGSAGPPAMGGTMSALASMGVAPEDIDLVYLTHFHGDHIAGLYGEDGNPAYPNASYACTRAEWDEWTGRWAASNTDSDRLQLQRFRALRDNFTFFGDGDEIAPGVSVVNLEGHTLGHSGLLVESGGERLLHVVDLLHGAFQFAQSDWQFVFDSDGELATQTRQRILRRCAEENLLTLFYHLKFPGLGTVSLDGDAFAWHPIA